MCGCVFKCAVYFGSVIRVQVCVCVGVWFKRVVYFVKGMRV